MKGRTTSAPKKIEKASAKERTSETSEATAVIAAASQSSAGWKPAPSREQIALRAYQLYLARGSEPGHEAEDWLAAEAELSA